MEGAFSSKQVGLMSEVISLKGKQVIVTGGASGIGKAITILFAMAGARVFILEMNEKESHDVVNEVYVAGGEASFIKCNVANHNDVRSTINAIPHTIDILVNNAGIAHVGNLQVTSENDFDRLYQVNVKGFYNCMSAVINRMVIQGGGVILNMASVAAIVGVPDRFAYSMTKGAVVSMTYSVARDYVKHNIRCNCISPARVHTPFVDGFISKNYPGKEKEIFERLSKSQPVGRMGQPKEIAQFALYLCSDQASFISGANLPIDGGFTTLNTQ